MNKKNAPNGSERLGKDHARMMQLITMIHQQARKKILLMVAGFCSGQGLSKSVVPSTNSFVRGILAPVLQ
jgi:hypothetical protein